MDVRRTVGLLTGLRSRDWAFLLALSGLLAGAPLTTLFIVKYLVDHIAVLATEHADLWTWTAAIWVPIATYFAINVVADSAETLQLLQISTLRDQIGFAIEDRTVSQALTHHDLGIFDRPEVKKLLVLASGATEHGQYLVQLLSNLATGILLAVPTLVVAATLGLWIPLLVLATTIPATLVQLRYERKSWDVETAHVDLANRGQQLHSTMLNPRFGGDVRAYLMHITLLPRWRSDARQLIDVRRTVKNRGALVVLALATLSGLGLLVPYGYVIDRAIAGDISLGTLALFIGLIPELRRSLFIVCANAGEISGAARQLTGLWDFEDTQPSIALNPRRALPELPTDPLTPPAIVFDRVSFGYTADRPAVLTDLDLILPAGSTTLVVGENGAGKTTLAKLLCRFYDPTGGVITADGVDLRDIDVLHFRHRTAILTQDPARLPLSVRDSLTITPVPVSETAITDALRDVGLYDTIDRSSAGLDTELSTTLTGGMDLSGGQWQRLAIARLLLHLPTATLAVIDEPTTALDPLADRELSDLLLERCAHATTLIVSHRLHVAPRVTHVAFATPGHPIDIAPHHQLLDTNPTYRAMHSAS